MKKERLLTLAALAIALLSWSAARGQGEEGGSSKIESRVQKTEAGELILLHTVSIEAPVAEVWKAYTTSEGYAAWAAPVVEVDLRAGGSIRSHYDPDAKLGDPQTNRLRIVNYVPERLLTLQADVSENWPEILRADAENLYNVILFESPTPDTTRILSYGLGYRDSTEMRGLMGFFEVANATLYEGLIAQLEGE
jgi:uncharacterized protein YndB with AHSA1/START domain